MPEHPRRILRKLLLGLVPALLLLGSAELAARLLWEHVPEGDSNLPPPPPPPWALQPDAPTRSLDEEVPIGPNGLREVPVGGAELRVLTLGDSNIFGYGLPHDQTLHAAIHTHLAVGGVRADVFCGGISGYSSSQSLLLLEEQGWDLDPDVLVVGNLLSDEFPEAQSDADRMAGRRTLPARLEWSLLRWSRAWKWFRLHVMQTETSERIIRQARSSVGGLQPRVSLERYEANLEAFCAAAEAHGVGLIFYQPTGIEIVQGLRETSEHGLAMERVATRCGVPIVLAIEELEADTSLRPEEAFMDDVHATGATNAVMGRAIARELLAHGWPEQRLVPRLPAGEPSP